MGLSPLHASVRATVGLLKQGRRLLKRGRCLLERGSRLLERCSRLLKMGLGRLKCRLLVLVLLLHDMARLLVVPC